MPNERALARREAEEELIRSTLRGVAAKAAHTLDGLYENPFLDEDRTEINPKYNPDAHRTWAECSMKTRAALIITKAVEGKSDADMGRALGVIILTGRATSVKDWEAQAREVDEESRRRGAIDVVAEVVKP